LTSPEPDEPLTIDLPSIVLPPSVSRVKPEEATRISRIWLSRQGKIMFVHGAAFAYVALFGLIALVGLEIRNPLWWIVALGLGVLASKIFTKSNKMQREPLVLEIYPTGLWFNWDNMFVPYKCLSAVEVLQNRERHSTGRRMIFTTAEPDKREFRMPGLESFLNDTYENIYYQIRELMETDAGGGGYVTASFTMESNSLF
jgi:hypothetical protein